MRAGRLWIAWLALLAMAACNGSSPNAGGADGVVDAGVPDSGPDAAVECEDIEDPSDRDRCSWEEMVRALPECDDPVNFVRLAFATLPTGRIEPFTAEVVSSIPGELKADSLEHGRVTVTYAASALDGVEIAHPEVGEMIRFDDWIPYEAARVLRADGGLFFEGGYGRADPPVRVGVDRTPSKPQCRVEDSRFVVLVTPLFGTVGDVSVPSGQAVNVDLSDGPFVFYSSANTVDCGPQSADCGGTPSGSFLLARQAAE